MVIFSDAKRYIFAAISILSIPSAYAAGFMAAVGSGIANLLDGGFFAQEFTRLTLIITGFFLAARFSTFTVFYILKMFHSLEKPSASTFWMRALTGLVWLVAILMVAPLLILWARIFLDARLILSFAVTSFMATIAAFMVTSFSIAVEKVRQDVDILEELKNFLNGKAGVLNAKIATGIVFALILISGNFGYHRAIALAIAKPVCISTKDEEIFGAIVGQTSFGYVIAQVEDREFHAFTFPVGIAILFNSTFSFISAQQDLRISTSCSR